MRDLGPRPHRTAGARHGEGPGATPARPGRGTTVMTEPTSTPPTTDDGTERVVVGVDGSTPSRAALIWGLREAAATGARVEVLSAYPIDVYWTDPFLVDTRRLTEIRTGTEDRAREFVEE